MIKKITDDEYFNTDAYSYSALKEILKSPAHYRAWKEQPKEPTAAMQIGSAIHCALLEPDEFENRYKITENDLRTKAGKADAEKAKFEGKVLLKSKDAANIEGMKRSFQSHAITSKLKGKAELAINTNIDKYKFKCKIDLLGDSIYDLKTCESANEFDFTRQIYNYKYYLQSFLYKRLVKIELDNDMDFIFIAIEKSAPHAIGIYQLSHEFIELAEHEFLLAMSRIEEFIEKGLFPAYRENMVTLFPEKWMLK